MDKDGKHTNPLPPTDRVRSIVLLSPVRLMLGKTDDDRDFKHSEHVIKRPSVGGVDQTVGCLGDRHREIL